MIQGGVPHSLLEGCHVINLVDEEGAYRSQILVDFEANVISDGMVPGTMEKQQALCKTAASPPWAREERLSTSARRKAHEDELDGLVSAWTRIQPAEAIMAELQAIGVPAGLVQTAEDLFEDPQLAHRSDLQWLEHLVMVGIPIISFPRVSTLTNTSGSYATQPLLMGAQRICVQSDPRIQRGRDRRPAHRRSDHH